MNDRLLSMLGIARKAGKLVFGRDRVAEAIAQKQAKLLICSEDLSPKSKKEMQFLCEKAEVPFMQVAYTMAQLSAATGARAGIYVLIDEGFAGALKALQP